MPTKNKRIQVFIPDKDLQDSIAEDCKRTGLKESQLIRLIVTEHYNKLKQAK